ncbi:MAG: SsrA-binding protein SmpB [Acidimicrobiia bacterium]|nr:SsrA-binding protein SmpB [Acidimicrobiia bacterium]
MANSEIGRKVVVSNRKARHDYDIMDTFECGIALLGSEVKSLRAGQVQLKDAYGEVRDGELWLYNAHISPYDFARGGGHEPDRPRKLLMHRRQIDNLAGRVAQDGLTLVPLAIYFVHGLAKVELALAKGIRRFDKRQKLKQREQQREMERARRSY